jgi:hypothetical protein
MIMGIDEIKKYCSLHQNTLAMVILDEQYKGKSEEKILRFGAWKSIFDL